MRFSPLLANKCRCAMVITHVSLANKLATEDAQKVHKVSQEDEAVAVDTANIRNHTVGLIMRKSAHPK